MNSMFSKLKESKDASEHINKLRNSNIYQNKELNVKLKTNGDIKSTDSFKTLYNITDGHYNCLSKHSSCKNSSYLSKAESNESKNFRAPLYFSTRNP